MILYFSGTGNSYYVAKSLAHENEELINMATSEKTDIADNRVGIVFPCYCSDIPPKVAEFLKKAKVSADYIFAVGTCGANVSASFGSIQYILQSKGERLNYAKKIVMPDSCVLLAFPPKTVEKLLKNQDERISKIKKEIEERKRIEIKAKKPFGFKTKFVWFAFKNIAGVSVKRRKVDTNACIKCGLCEKRCEMHNIKIEGDKVVFGDNCTYCFACINACPKNAISFGMVKATDKKRYIHPIYKNK